MAGSNRNGAPGDTPAHVPVLLDAVLETFLPLDGKHIMDGTFGAGGYSAALLAANGHVLAIDRDPDVLPFAEKLEAEFPHRFKFVSGEFGDLDKIAETAGPLDGVVLDIGLSSMQIEDHNRGFSFLRSGPLDMRMSATGITAAQLIADTSEKELGDILFGLGEERRSRAIASAIAVAKKTAPIKTTDDLVAIVEKVIRHRPDRHHPATRTFQALRIAVNGEIGQLVEALFAAERTLSSGGVLSVVSFHSIEDRIVKRFFKPVEPGSRHRPQMPIATQKSWARVASPVRASQKEIAINPRARSATLRSAIRGEAPARPTDTAGLGVPGAALKRLVA
ncbi:MAG: 16S rRNA (cytosine(1402)-N(4))-methyltransferase RsmH [Alphaproteobacteria bacterium]|nr:16S rRNA (cytosine(1402)-N(4))-methyltransferase RsmH [Alphaproteobacteria bacterium]